MQFICDGEVMAYISKHRKYSNVLITVGLINKRWLNYQKLPWLLPLDWSLKAASCIGFNYFTLYNKSAFPTKQITDLSLFL